jgi:endonuclease-3
MNTSTIRDILVKRSEELLAQPLKSVPFTSNLDADALLNDLDHYPHAFVIGCLMDRQWKSEKCWLVPYLFKERSGSFAFDDLATLSHEEVVSLFVQPRPLHRWKEKMANIFHLAIQRIGEQYSGLDFGHFPSTTTCSLICKNTTIYSISVVRKSYEKSRKLTIMRNWPKSRPRDES